jgi:hypothetical protein
MFSNLSIKIIATVSAVLLVSAALTMYFIQQSFGAETACKVTVGGKQNPCQCTQRLER